MRWQRGRRSENVEDRRGGGGARGAKLGGGIISIIIVLVLIYLGADPGQMLQLVGNNPQPPQANAPVDPANDPQKELVDFVSVVLADTEDVWNKLFREMGKSYREPKLVVFSDRVESACGLANAAVGPFYCGADENLYIDLTFYNELKNRHHAPGDFAQAYVIAHEVGHHVQNLLGITDQVHSQKDRISEKQYNDLSVRLELQADFFAGVWAHHAQKMRGILEEGDIEEALNAASAIGDDRLQREARGYVVPDSFTHGTSAQRVRWFRKGLVTGDMTQGDTFSTETL